MVLKTVLFNFLVFISINSISSWEVTDDLTLQIKDGKILGRFITSHMGKPIKAFLGIPYAQPPVGELRFKAPQKVQPWEGIKLTQFDGQRCVQVTSTFAPGAPLIGNEDCLYLNVYTPVENPGNLPVVFWIHGGAFVAGDGSYAFYGPDYVIDHDVVMVAGNYRLGVLGFLSTESKDAQGNFGLKDQNLILQWIQENIEYFGGNKSSVTIWGGKKNILCLQSFNSKYF
jgi:carboxylesterase type B